MTPRPRKRLPSSNPCRRGLSLVEVTVSTLLVGTILVTSMRTLASSVRHRTDAGDREKGQMLAAQLASEALTLPYEDPDNTPLFGRESGETQSYRVGWNDFDDFHGLNQSPPLDPAGVPLANLSVAWQWDVTVAFADPANPAATAGSDQGLKRITVTVRKNGTVVGQVVSLRSNH